MGCYIISGMCSVLGMDQISNLFNCMLICSVIMLTAWMYIKYTGKYVEGEEFINAVASTIWKTVLSPLAEKAISPSTNAATIEVARKISSVFVPTINVNSNIPLQDKKSN